MRNSWSLYSIADVFSLGLQEKTTGFYQVNGSLEEFLRDKEVLSNPFLFLTYLIDEIIKINPTFNFLNALKLSDGSLKKRKKKIF
jgi:hypothetical protein